MTHYVVSARKPRRLSPAQVDARWPRLDATACPLMDAARLSAAARTLSDRESKRKKAKRDRLDQ